MALTKTEDFDGPLGFHGCEAARKSCEGRQWQALAGGKALGRNG